MYYVRIVKVANSINNNDGSLAFPRAAISAGTADIVGTPLGTILCTLFTAQIDKQLLAIRVLDGTVTVRVRLIANSINGLLVGAKKHIHWFKLVAESVTPRVEVVKGFKE
jgi:hypothetical protein